MQQTWHKLSGRPTQLSSISDVHPCNAPSLCVIWKCWVKVTTAANHIRFAAGTSSTCSASCSGLRGACSRLAAALPAVPMSQHCVGISNHPSRCRSRECPLCFRHLQLEVSISQSDTLHALPELEACRVEALEEMWLVAWASDTVFRAASVSWGTLHVQQTVRLGRPVPLRIKPAASFGY